MAQAGSTWSALLQRRPSWPRPRVCGTSSWSRSGSCALFCYITAVVLRYADRSLGVPASLVIIGLVLIGLAVVTVRLGRATQRQSGLSPGTTTLRSRLNGASDTAA